MFWHPDIATCVKCNTGSIELQSRNRMLRRLAAMRSGHQGMPVFRHIGRTIEIVMRQPSLWLQTTH